MTEKTPSLALFAGVLLAGLVWTLGIAAWIHTP